MTTTHDLHFLSRMMGSPVPPGRDPVKWTGAALENPKRRIQAIVAIETLADELAGVEDVAASTPIERTPTLTVVHTGIAWANANGGDCACESGLAFRDCHGAAGAES